MRMPLNVACSGGTQRGRWFRHSLRSLPGTACVLIRRRHGVEVVSLLDPIRALQQSLRRVLTIARHHLA
jgi:hypothetical protein